MRCVLNLRKGLYFINGEFLQSWTDFILFDLDNLDSHRLISFLVDGLVHFTELSLPDHCLQAVVFNFLAHGTVSTNITRLD